MSSNNNPNNYIKQSFLLPSPPILVHPPFQPSFYCFQQPNTYYIHSHPDGPLTLFNSLQNYEQDNTNFAGCKQIPLTKPHQKKLNYKFIPKNQVFDLSNIKILPPQEKSNMKDLRCRIHRRWTIAEDQLLYDLRTNAKLSWKDIACKFPTRTLGACQLRANKLKKIYKKKLTSKHFKNSLYD